jgi:hypothetical protein
MKGLPESVLTIRDCANACADEHHEAWDRLNACTTPTLRDLEQWLEVRSRFHSAQSAFEDALSTFIRSGLNP